MCDFARREYRTKCRFFRDSDALVDIQWYRAAPDAPSLGFPSSILSLDWTNDEADRPYLQRPGEVFGEPRPYSFHGPLIDPTYAHVCGTPEEFQLGAVFDATRDVKYDEQGLPLCCGQPVTPMMGVVIGLDAETSATVLPGVDCDTAATLAPGDVGVGAAGPMDTSWWVAAADSTKTYTVTVALPVGRIQIRVTEGVDCASRVGLAGAVIDAPGGSFQFTPLADDFVWLEGIWVHGEPDPTNFTIYYSLT